MINFRLVTATAVLASGAVFATPAAAVVQTFATFSAPTSAYNFAFVNSGNSNSRTEDATFYSTSTATSQTKKGVTSVKSYGTAGAVDVRFSFLQSAFTTQPIVQNITASLTATGTIAKNSQFTTISFGGQTLFSQTGFSGTLTFLSKAPIVETAPNFVTHTFPTGSVLLRAVFSGASISGALGGTSGGAADSTSVTLGGGTVTFTSDFLDFTPTIQRDLALSFTSTLAPFAQATTANNHALKSFVTNGGGQFSSDPAPVVNGLVTVPEPAVWGLLVVGFGLIGVQTRRRGQPMSVNA